MSSRANLDPCLIAGCCHLANDPTAIARLPCKFHNASCNVFLAMLRRYKYSENLRTQPASQPAKNAKNNVSPAVAAAIYF